MGVWQRWRHNRHAIKLAVVAVAAATAVSVPVSGQAASPPQEPGVTLRVFDVQTPLSAICVIKQGQTPNVDKLMSSINWTAPA